MNFYPNKAGFLGGFLNAILTIAVVLNLIASPFLVNTAKADSTSSCSASVAVNAGDTVVWTANLSGSGDTVNYSWSGDEGLSGSSQTVTITYSSSGTKNATAVVTAVGSNTSTVCSGLSYTITPGLNIAPVITLSGINPQVITQGNPYTELGATANDAEDGDITANIVIDSTAVNTSVVGSYSVTYNVTDSQGLSAVEVVRTVNVVAPTNNPPVITLSGINPQQIVQGTAYTELGATANDTEDGDITANIAIDSSAVNTAVIGSYQVTYNVVDSGGLSAVEVTRDVIVASPTSATCSQTVTTTANGQTVVWSTTYVPLSQHPVFIWSGDDGLSGNTRSISHTYANSGTYSGTVVVSADSAVTCNITTTVNTPPTITLIGIDPITLTVGDTFTDPGATANDLEDGDLTSQIVVSGTVNTAVAGTYVLVYTVTDSDGASASVTRDVIVVPAGACDVPVITSSLTASSQVNQAFSYTITANSNTHPISLTGFDVNPATLPSGLSFATTTGSAIISGTPTQTGTYNVAITVTNACGATNATLVLNITGGGGPTNNPPVITLNGLATINITVGDTFTDPGATANDTEDGDLTAQIVVNGSVDANTVGTYTLTYTVSDSQGLSATPVSRTVIVNPIGQCIVPQFTSALKASGTKGQNFSYTVTYTPAVATTITVDNSDLPAGITFDATTGVISGTPTNTGNSDVDIKLVNNCGETNVRIEITINEPPCTNCGGGGGGGGGSFVPLPTLVITNENIKEVLSGMALVSWNTNTPATSRVVYGRTSISSPDASLPNYGYASTTVTLSPLVTTHIMGVVFEPGVTYFFRPISTKDNLTAVGKELAITIPSAPATCSYLRDFLRIDFQNDPVEVKKLQAYLNSFEGENLSVDGVFDAKTLEAVNRYQDKYLPQILEPWGHDRHTGYVYILTKKHINETYCKTAYPLTTLEEDEINAYRNLLASLRDAGESDVILVTPEDVGNTTRPEVNDGTVGVTEPVSDIEDVAVVATTTAPVVVVNPIQTQATEIGAIGKVADMAKNIASIVFAFPDSIKDTVVCIGYLAIALIIIYVIATLLVNILSRNDALTTRQLRMRKIASYVVGIVYALIPVLIFEKNCLTLPLLVILAILIISFLYLWSREVKQK